MIRDNKGHQLFLPVHSLWLRAVAEQQQQQQEEFNNGFDQIHFHLSSFLWLLVCWLLVGWQPKHHHHSHSRRVTLSVEQPVVEAAAFGNRKRVLE